jgi:hypothetical protein
MENHIQEMEEISEIDESTFLLNLQVNIKITKNFIIIMSFK